MHVTAMKDGTLARYGQATHQTGLDPTSKRTRSATLLWRPHRSTAIANIKPPRNRKFASCTPPTHTHKIL